MPSSARGAWAEREVLAQVHAPHGVVRGEFLSRAFFQYFSFKEQVSPVRDVQGLLDVVVGDEHANAFVPKLIHNALNVLYGNGVHTGKGLIEQDE